MTNKPLIILINGKARSGKNELAEIIKKHNKHLNVDIIGNADAVKDISSEIFGWDDIKDEKGRRLLINVANTAYAYDKYFWEKRTESAIVFGYDDIIIIPDFRYINTYEYFTKEGYDVKTIHIQMDKDINTLNNEVKKDKTEQKLDVKFDFEIVNEFGNLAKLNEFVKNNLIF